MTHLLRISFCCGSIETAAKSKQRQLSEFLFPRRRRHEESTGPRSSRRLPGPVRPGAVCPRPTRKEDVVVRAPPLVYENCRALSSSAAAASSSSTRLRRRSVWSAAPENVKSCFYRGMPANLFYWPYGSYTRFLARTALYGPIN